MGAHRAGTSDLERRDIQSWSDINAALDELQAARDPDVATGEPAWQPRGGVAFVTFDYGIDGVTIEIAKYAACLERELGSRGVQPVIHCIGGGFHDSADQVLAERWRRHRIDQANGWSKWHDGVWFDRMFRADMPEGSRESDEVAREIWRQAIRFAQDLESIIAEHRIDLLVPVNANSNPGNPAMALALVLVSETSAVRVLNSCHDFYWDSGKPAAERVPGEAPGARDHFFRNQSNESFFRFLERIHPWDGARWLTLVINRVQREELIRRSDIEPSRVRELGTLIEDAFFVPITPTRKAELRRQLGHILADGERTVAIESIEDFEARASGWMAEQLPVVCGAEPGLMPDLADPHALWFLQPTRILPRKRIPCDWDLIEALFEYVPFGAMFQENPQLTLTLHVTGPVPAEHESALRGVLDGFKRVLTGLPDHIGRRVYLALSAGKLAHSTLQGRGRDYLSIADLYHLADLVLLPSATEGRGLPILEAAATGVPLVCARYHPREAFEAVIGSELTERLRIRYLPFPRDRIATELLQEITDLVFLPAASARLSLHNRRAVAARFGMRELVHSFCEALDLLGGRARSATSEE